jgi:DNA-binding NtrC family response regulator
MPPLRDRKSDIPLLVNHFLEKLQAIRNTKEKKFSTEAMEVLIQYNWPGNIRELENTIERSFILADDAITPDSLPSKIHKGGKLDPGDRSLESVERRHVLEVLDSHGGDKVAAAKTLAIDLSTLYRKLKKYEEEKVSSIGVQQ